VKLTDSELVHKFPAFYGTRGFIIAFTTARHLPLPWAWSIQPIHHPTSWRSMLILSFHLCLGFPSGPFTSGFPAKNPVYTSPLSHTCYMCGSSHSSWFVRPSKILWEINESYC